MGTNVRTLYLGRYFTYREGRYELAVEHYFLYKIPEELAAQHSIQRGSLGLFVASPESTKMQIRSNFPTILPLSL